MDDATFGVWIRVIAKDALGETSPNMDADEATIFAEDFAKRFIRRLSRGRTELNEGMKYQSPAHDGKPTKHEGKSSH